MEVWESPPMDSGFCSTTITRNMATFDFIMAYRGGYEWLAATGEVVLLGFGISLRASPSHNGQTDEGYDATEEDGRSSSRALHFQWLLVI